MFMEEEVGVQKEGAERDSFINSVYYRPAEQWEADCVLWTKH